MRGRSCLELRASRLERRRKREHCVDQLLRYADGSKLEYERAHQRDFGRQNDRPQATRRKPIAATGRARSFNLLARAVTRSGV
jgi:hypothetical protein